MSIKILRRSNIITRPKIIVLLEEKRIDADILLLKLFRLRCIIYVGDIKRALSISRRAEKIQ